MRTFENCILAVALSFLMVGCASYEKPSYYVHLPEYGYLPVIDDGDMKNLMISYVAYDWYDYNASTKGNHIGDVGLAQRDSLPTTKEEAIAIVDKNFTLEGELQQSKAINTVILAPIGIPFTIIYWAPGIAMVSEYYAHRQSNDTAQNTLLEQRSDPSAISRKEEQGANKQVKIRVTDQQGQPVSNAEILLLLSPISVSVIRQGLIEHRRLG